jgi:hypothetical protein
VWAKLGKMEWQSWKLGPCPSGVPLLECQRLNWYACKGHSRAFMKIDNKVTEWNGGSQRQCSEWRLGNAGLSPAQCSSKKGTHWASRQW